MEENKIEMSEKEKILNGNKLIAEFDQAHKDIYGKWFDSNRNFMGYNESEFMYHKNWQWQIPVYSKLAKEIREVAAKEKRSISPNLQHAQLVLSYGDAVLNDNKLKGFEIIIENLNWLNKIK